MNVNNTQDKITILIPRYTDFQPPFENWLLSEANTHVIRGLENSSIHFEFMPSNYCLSYELLLKFDAKPTKSDYDRKKVIPDFSSCNSTGKIEELRFNICSVYSRFVSTNLHNASGGNCTLRRGLDIHIKNLTSQCSLNPYHLFVGSNETKDGTYYLGKLIDN